MASKITLVKSYRNKETLRLLELQEVAELIRSGEYDRQVAEFRRDLPTMTYATIGSNGTIEGYENWPKELPRICFALEQENRNHELITKGYTGLVLLEVNNLTGNDEAEAIRRGAGEMPQTLMAFVGADGQSVKIVCKGELLEVRENYSLTSHLSPLTSETIPLFHENLYERARLIYNGQLGVTVEKLEPLTQRICYMSSDPQMVYNPLARNPQRPSLTRRPTDKGRRCRTGISIAVIRSFSSLTSRRPTTIRRASPTWRNAATPRCRDWHSTVRRRASRWPSPSVRR